MTLCKKCVIVNIIQSHDKKRKTCKSENGPTSFNYGDEIGIRDQIQHQYTFTKAWSDTEKYLDYVGYSKFRQNMAAVNIHFGCKIFSYLFEIVKIYN